MQMRLVWPIVEPWRGFHYLIDSAVDEVEKLAEEQGCKVVGIPEGWSVEAGPIIPGWAAYRLVLTCIVPVAAREQEVAA